MAKRWMEFFEGGESGGGAMKWSRLHGQLHRKSGVRFNSGFVSTNPETRRRSPKSACLGRQPLQLAFRKSEL